MCQLGQVRNFFTNLDIRQVQDNKRFWKTVKPLLSSKSKSSDKIIRTEHDSIITDNEEIAETLNDHFINIADSLKIPTRISNLNDIHYITDFFRNHHSINKIKEHVHTDYPFNFQNVTLEEVIKEVNNLKDKGAPIESIPVGILKRQVNIYAEKLTKCFNEEVVGKACFPDSLKEAEVMPVFKDKGDSNDKSNYRTISCLPPLAKVFEKLVFKQLSSYFENIFSPILSGFRKGCNTQSALLRMLEIWYKHLDKGKTVGAILMDLSKAFDCVRHDFLIAKLSAYGLSGISLRLICSYLSNRTQRVKANFVFSDSLNLKSGVPQDSILGPLFFNIYLNDLFYFVDSKICNYADDNTIFAASHDPNEIKSQLQQSLKCISEWFQINYFVLNLDKCKLLLIHHRNLDLFDDFSITVDGITIEPSNSRCYCRLRFKP